MYILCQFAYSAVDIVICEDNEGNQSFHQACPPGTNLIEKKKVSTGKDTSKEVDLAELNIVIYTIPECLSCEEVIIYMKSRDIPFNEKDINKDVETQKELTEITGKLTVPVTVIGEDHITGYDREKIASILDRILSPE
tara:strand:+ start:188 stop:601 length:414 start_codon:yes stop_codon:yes gene_type:complete